jgi:DNA repair protein RadA/Sms
VSTAGATGSAGGTSQVRESAARLISFAKTSGTPVVLVGHVTKDGAIAGPRTLEHMVDVVLYLEGDADHGLRFLRGIKNRYGSINEIGVFAMTSAGMEEVSDPSGVLVAHRDERSPGTVLFPTVEGRRPLVVEIQALVVPTNADQPRRAVNGVPSSRVHQIIGVLERHAAMPLRLNEVYVNVMGGIKVTEPGADLPIALAIASSYADVPLGRTAAWGELGLTGDVRPVGRSAVRRTEAERIGATPILTGDQKATRLFEVLIECGFGASMR